MNFKFQTFLCWELEEQFKRINWYKVKIKYPVFSSLRSQNIDTKIKYYGLIRHCKFYSTFLTSDDLIEEVNTTVDILHFTNQVVLEKHLITRNFQYVKPLNSKLTWHLLWLESKPQFNIMNKEKSHQPFPRCTIRG